MTTTASSLTIVAVADACAMVALLAPDRPTVKFSSGSTVVSIDGYKDRLRYRAWREVSVPDAAT